MKKKKHDKSSGSLAGFRQRKDCLNVFFYITLASKEEADTFKRILSDSACSSVPRRILDHPSFHTPLEFDAPEEGQSYGFRSTGSFHVLLMVRLMWNTGYADLMILIGVDVFKHG